MICGQHKKDEIEANGILVFWLHTLANILVFRRELYLDKRDQKKFPKLVIPEESFSQGLQNRLRDSERNIASIR